MNLEKVIPLLSILIIFCAAQTPGAAFLLIPPTAKATSMGYAHTAVCDDASANYYNAAGLSFFDLSNLTASYCGYLTDVHPGMHYLYLGLLCPLFTYTWGFDITYFRPGKVEVYDSLGTLQGERTVWRLAVKVNYAKKFLEKLSFAIGWKYIYQKYAFALPEEPWQLGFDSYGSGSSWAFDFNFLYKLTPDFSIGTVLHNVGPKIKYRDVEQSNPLPLTYHLGIAYNSSISENFSFTISGELTKVLVGMFEDEENTFWDHLKDEFDTAWKSIGLELVFYEKISLRGGYFYDKESERKGFTFGGGLKLVNLEVDIGIDENIFDFKTQNRKISISFDF
jgi:hypothetical protein